MNQAFDDRSRAGLAPWHWSGGPRFNSLNAQEREAIVKAIGERAFAALAQRWEGVVKAAEQERHRSAAVWIEDRRAGVASELVDWCQRIYLPLLKDRVWHLARRVLNATSATETPETIGELGAWIACEQIGIASAPKEALELWGRGEALTHGAETALANWIHKIRRLTATSGSLILHLGLKEVAQRCARAPQLVDPIAGCVDLRPWACLELFLQERGLTPLSQPLPIFEKFYQSALTTGRLLALDWTATIVGPRDHLSNDPLGKELGLVRLVDDEGLRGESWALIAKFRPLAILKILRDWHKLAAFAAMPRFVELDPLGRYLIFTPYQHPTPEDRISPRAFPEGLVGRIHPVALVDLVGRLRTAQSCWASGIFPIEQRANEQLFWLFPVPLESLRSECLLIIATSAMAHGRELKFAVERANLDASRAAEECKWAVKCAIDGTPFEWVSRNYPSDWSNEWICAIQRLYISARKFKEFAVRDVESREGQLTPQRQLTLQTLVAERLQLAHAYGGYGAHLATEPLGEFEHWEDQSGHGMAPRAALSPQIAWDTSPRLAPTR